MWNHLFHCFSPDSNKLWWRRISPDMMKHPDSAAWAATQQLFPAGGLFLELVRPTAACVSAALMCADGQISWRCYNLLHFTQVMRSGAEKHSFQPAAVSVQRKIKVHVLVWNWTLKKREVVFSSWVMFKLRIIWENSHVSKWCKYPWNHLKQSLHGSSSIFNITTNHSPALLICWWKENHLTAFSKPVNLFGHFSSNDMNVLRCLQRRN